MSYVPNKIGIGITTRNRYDVFKNSYQIIKEKSPSDFKIVVVDDASSEIVQEATFRFEENVGVATAKNKCFELLDDCEHIFLFDDDTYPLVEDWWKPYIESKEPHLMYTFQNFIGSEIRVDGCEIMYHDEFLIGYSHPRGCLLYFHHKTLETIGGMDTDFGKWGYEHLDISNRIFNAGLTKCRYGDIPNSNTLIFSMDENQLVSSSVANSLRGEYIKKYKKLLNENYLTTKYCKYK